MTFFTDYHQALQKAFEKNPTKRLEELLDGLKSSAADVLNMLVTIQREWEKHREKNVRCGIMVKQIDNNGGSEHILHYDFVEDLRTVIQDGTSKSVMYTVDSAGFLLQKQFCEQPINYLDIVEFTRQHDEVGFFLGINGVDLYIKGITFESQNRMDSYSDIIRFRKLRSIGDYRELLRSFFLSRVQYDRFKNYFADKADYNKAIHHIFNKHSKLLRSKPEVRFQRELDQFLRENCEDKVLTEVRNMFGERYDVWVVTSDDKLFVFELKWLGKSITPDGAIFDQYNTSERGLEGAYQLKEYIDNSDEYAKRLGEFRIHCGVLVIYDAREVPDDIVYPSDFNDYPQIDLTQHFKMEKSKPVASKVYKLKKVPRDLGKGIIRRSMDEPVEVES